MDDITQSIVTLALEKGFKISTAESCTGGLLSGALTNVAGSSGVFEYGFVTYANTAKIQLLQVSAQTLLEYGAVSEQVASQMAQGAQKSANADIAVAITGIAGPGGSEHKPEGRVCFATSIRGKNAAFTVEFGAIGRQNVRRAAVLHACKLLFNALRCA